MNNLQIEFKNGLQGENFHLQLQGDLESMSAVDFKNDFIRVFCTTPKNCVLDITEVKNVDLTGLNALAMIHSEVKNSSLNFQLICQEDHPVQELLHLTKFSRFITTQAA